MTEPLTAVLRQEGPQQERPIKQLRDVLSMLCNYIWTNNLRHGEHLWSIPVDHQRDFDCILSDAINELEQLRALSASRTEPQDAAIVCPACGGQVKQVVSATLSLALWQHWNWVCQSRTEPTRKGFYSEGGKVWNLPAGTEPDATVLLLQSLIGDLGLTADATISTVQRGLHVGTANAMRLLAVREAIAALSASRTAQEGQQEEKDMDETPKFDDPSEGPFEFAWFCRHNGEPIQTVADVVETLTLSADKSTRPELFGVCLAERDEDGKQIVVCYTGNGPRSEVNARLIARLLSDYRTTAPTPRSAESFGLKPEMQPVVDELRRRMALPSSPAEGEKEEK